MQIRHSVRVSKEAAEAGREGFHKGKHLLLGNTD